MSTLTFKDGMSFNTDTELHSERRFDGWYVVGHGILIPVKNEAEANLLISEMNRG